MLTVRPGSDLDEDAALALWQVDQGQRGRRSGGARAQQLRTRLRAPDTLLLVAERDRAPAGVLLAGIAGPGLLEVLVLASASGAAGTGAPRALLAALLRRYPQVVVRVEPDDTDALALYGLAGFVPDDEHDGPDVLLRTPS